MLHKETEDFVAAKIIALANRCIKQKDSFHIVLAGGETPRAVYTLLTEMVTDWEKWHVYFGDERCVPAQDLQRNDVMAFDAWLAHVDIPHTQIHNIPAELPQKICVEQYTQTLKNIGNFNLVLLGLGEDGHTASLFPGNDWGDRPDAPDVIAVDNAPKAPAQRITLSTRRLSAADNVWFLIKGDSKKDILQRWQRGEVFPASAIKPKSGVEILQL
ncbi:MAG TPA: 6-phosphogluconolactonase [Pseudomonadales bacterium]|nr:6-phosphogluconolactonase [Pseudomonadales bacterium]